MLRRFLRLLPALLTWALVCIMFWGWIFGMLTDAPASKKLIVYIDAPTKNTWNWRAGLRIISPARRYVLLRYVHLPIP